MFYYLNLWGIEEREDGIFGFFEGGDFLTVNRIGQSECCAIGFRYVSGNWGEDGSSKFRGSDLKKNNFVVYSEHRTYVETGAKMKAGSLEQVIFYFNHQTPLNPVQKDEWDSFYIDTQRLDINRIRLSFLSSPSGHKLLFGGHSGNGKSTELNRFVHDPRIQERFAVIKFDIPEVLNPNDIEIVELLLVICLQILDFAEKNNMQPTPYIKGEFDKLEGFFRDKLKIETSRLSMREKSIGVNTEAGAGFKFPFLKLGADFYAKMKGQVESRQVLRKEYRPRLNELIDLVKALVKDLKLKLNGKEPFIIIDGLDRTSVGAAEKLFVEDGANLSMISNTTMLFTVPISLIHSVKSAQVEAGIGKIWVLKNMRLKTRDNKEDLDSQKNKALMKEAVLRRMEPDLIDDDALDMAIHYSGGVFRTLIELIAEAAVDAKAGEGECILLENMQIVVTEQKIKKSRPLNRSHWEILMEINEHKNFISEMDEKKLELLAGLFALEYINGEEWYEVNPLLHDRLERYKEIYKKEK